MNLLRYAALLLAVLSWCCCVPLSAFAQGDGKAPAAQPKSVPTPADAVGWALADVAQIPASERPFMRYLWIPPWGDAKWLAALNFTVNTAASQSATLHLGTPVANGWLIRYDLSQLVPDDGQLTRLLEVWSGMAVDDPYFHVPSDNTGVNIAVVAPHLPQDQALALSGLQLAPGTIYRADWFIVLALSTIEDDKGRYYDMRQVELNPKAASGMDVWLSKRGVFVGTSNALGGEKRAALLESLVTGKPRRVDVFGALTGPGHIGSITRDVTDGRINADNHPIRALLDFPDEGREIIVTMPNGMLDYLLANAKGEIIREAPPELVRDHTIPAPQTARLQPAISCIRCHGDEQSVGWKRVNNDVESILGSELDIFADLGSGLSSRQVRDKLASLYAAKKLDHPDGYLGMARRIHAEAVAITARGVDFGKSKKGIVTLVAEQVSSIYEDYKWNKVTPQRAALELGYDFTGIQSRENPLTFVVGEPSPAELQVDPIAALLRLKKGGRPVTRRDFEVIYGDLAVRAESLRKAKGE